MDDNRKKVEIVDLDVDLISHNAWNPNTQSEDVFNGLVSNIDEIGMVEPVLVVPDEANEGKYVVISGEHRLDACKALGYTTIPAIVSEGLDVDMQKFQTVRMNVLKGKLDPVRFTRLFDEMADKYGEEVTKELMRFADEKAFKDVYMNVKKQLPKDMQDKLNDSKEEIKTVDDLSRILNELFNKYGNTLDQHFMVFTFGGKTNLWVIMTDELRKLVVDTLVVKATDLGFDMSEFFTKLLQESMNDVIQRLIAADK